MRTITKKINLFKFEELSAKAKERACEDYDTFLSESGESSDRLKELIENALQEAGLSSLKDIWFSYGYSQGDGVAFYGDVDIDELKAKDEAFASLEEAFHVAARQSVKEGFGDAGLIVEVRSIGNHNTNHWNTMRTDVSLDAYPWEETAEISESLKAIQIYLNKKLVDLSRQCEKDGYADIEFMSSEEQVKENSEANEYEYTEDGKFHA